MAAVKERIGVGGGRPPAAERVAKALSEMLPPQKLEEFAERLLPVQEERANAERRRLAAALTGDLRVYAPEERARLETDSLTRFFQLRRELLEGALTTAQVAALLGTSRQTPHDRAKRHFLLALWDNGEWRFPLWQFDPNGRKGVVEGLPQTLHALASVPPLAQARWLTTPNRYLSDYLPLSPIEALRRGILIEKVFQLARTVEAH